MKIIKLIILALLILLSLAPALLLILGFPIQSLIYWLLLVVYVFLVWDFRLGSKFSLYLSLSLFIFSAMLVTFELRYPGEILMRVSFLALIIGFVQSLIEYKTQ